MPRPTFKAEYIISSKDLFHLTDFSLPDYITHLTKESFKDVNINYDDDQVVQFVKQNCSIEFTLNDVAFRIKII